MTLTETRTSSLTCRPRWTTPRTDRATLGQRVAEVSAQLGLPLQPWQRHVADVALEINPKTGRLVYREINLLVPRQSGKTTLLLSVMVQRALGFGQSQRQRISYTAQTRNDARHKWEDEHLHLLDHSPYRRLYRTRKTNGSEAILWKNGSIHDLMATTQKSGHGPTLDLGVVDEAFAQPDWRLDQAMKPAMLTRPEPQQWVVSTAGTAESVYLRSKVEAGRARCEAGLTESVAYFEWSADEDDDPADPATWWSCMPALGNTVAVEAVAADFAALPLGEFRRAYLNQWTTAKNEPVFTDEQWAATADPRSQIAGPVSFAFDVSIDRSWSSICSSGLRGDGLPHVEVVEHRQGTGWVAGRLAELVGKWGPPRKGPDGKLVPLVVCDPKGPAGGLLADLAKAKVDVHLTSTGEATQACGMLFDDVVDGRLRHLDQPELNVAVGDADRRPVGDAWLWSRKGSVGVISPLVAATLARWWVSARPAESKEADFFTV